MKFDAEGNRRRREFRIREIGSKIADAKATEILGYTKQNTELNEAMPTKRIGLLRFQIYMSLLILVLITAIHLNEMEWSEDAQSFTKEALTQDFNFAGVTAWIEERFGQLPSLLPTIQFLKSKEAIPVFSPPLTGVVVESFSPALTGVIIETRVAEEVHPIGPGWVRSVEKKKGMGIIVVIQHGDALESTYGFLGKAFVKKNDWVYPDEVIGRVGEQSLFLQIREKKAFIDPMDVIPFE